MPTLFQSIAAFFTGGLPNQRNSTSQYHLRRDEAILSIDDAFSIPPETDSVITTKAFTYPPPASTGSYDTVPNSATSPSFPDLRFSLYPRNSKSRPSSLLPTQHSPLTPLPSYPSLARTWTRLKTWLEQNYPELGDTLNYGIQPPDLARLELELGQVLPRAVKDSYLIIDGQEAESAAGCSEGLFFGLTLLPLEDVIDEWKFWREVDEDPTTGANPALLTNMQSIPPGWIRKAYSQRGWIPLVTDKVGNYLGIDLNPDEQGSVGQVIVFGRDFDTKVVMWRGEGEAGWATWLASFVEDLENGEGYELGAGASEETSDSSEDDVGYESYFFDGAGKSVAAAGGDAGGGGIRLAGEYKHWPVLEALADRSMRKWIETGVMLPLTPPKESLSSSSSSSSPQTSNEPSEGENRPSTSDIPSSYPNGDPLSAGTALNSSLSSSEEPVAQPSISATQPREGSSPKSKSKLSTSMPKPAPVVLPTEEDILPSPDELYPYERPDHRIDEEMGDVVDEGDIETGLEFGSKGSRLTRLQLSDDQSIPISSSSSETLLNTVTPVYTRGNNSLDSDTLDSQTPILSRSNTITKPVVPLLPLAEPQQETGDSLGIESKISNEEVPEPDGEEFQTVRLVTENPETVALIDVEQDGDPFIVASDASTSSRPNSTSSVASVKSTSQSFEPPGDVS